MRSTMRHEAEVLAKTLVGLPTPGNDCGAAGSAPWRAGGFGPIAADPRKQNEIYIPQPHTIGVDDGYELDITASCVRRKVGQSRLLTLLVCKSTITINWAVVCCHQPSGKESCTAPH